MKLKLISASLICFITVLACKPSSISRLQKELLNGTWNSIGYGIQLQIDSKTVIAYDTFKGGCALNAKIPINSFTNYYKIINVNDSILHIKSGFTEYKLIKALHSNKQCSINCYDKSPINNFDALWKTFNEHYVSFNLRQVNWNKLKQKYRNQLTELSTNNELYTVLNDMVNELNDGHAFIDNLDETETDDENDSLRTLVINKINAKYVNQLKTYNKGVVNWGIINNSIGYIQFNDFEDLANYNIDNNLSVDKFWDNYYDIADNSENYTQDVLSSFN